MASQNIRLTLPSALAEEFDRVRKSENRSASDLVREAVRNYLFFLRRFPEAVPTRSELVAIGRGRTAYARGESLNLDDLIRKMGTGRNQARSKRSKQVSRER